MKLALCSTLWSTHTHSCTLSAARRHSLLLAEGRACRPSAFLSAVAHALTSPNANRTRRRTLTQRRCPRTSWSGASQLGTRLAAAFPPAFLPHLPFIPCFPSTAGTTAFPAWRTVPTLVATTTARYVALSAAPHGAILDPAPFNVRGPPPAAAARVSSRVSHEAAGHLHDYAQRPLSHQYKVGAGSAIFQRRLFGRSFAPRPFLNQQRSPPFRLCLSISDFHPDQWNPSVRRLHSP